jgi:hypothetical protein
MQACAPNGHSPFQIADPSGQPFSVVRVPIDD